MALFRCSILGENFPGALLGGPDLVGFYTTRFVDAASAEEAEIAALKLLQEDKRLDLPLEVRTQDAKVYFEDIVEVPPDTERAPNGGFSFFVMGT